MNAPVRQKPDQAVQDAREFVDGFVQRGQKPFEVLFAMGATTALASTTWDDALEAAIMKARHIGPCVMVEISDA